MERKAFFCILALFMLANVLPGSESIGNTWNLPRPMGINSPSAEKENIQYDENNFLKKKRYLCAAAERLGC